MLARTHECTHQRERIKQHAAHDCTQPPGLSDRDMAGLPRYGFEPFRRSSWGKLAPARARNVYALCLVSCMPFTEMLNGNVGASRL